MKKKKYMYKFFFCLEIFIVEVSTVSPTKPQIKLPHAVRESRHNVDFCLEKFAS